MAISHHLGPAAGAARASTARCGRVLQRCSPLLLAGLLAACASPQASAPSHSLLDAQRLVGAASTSYPTADWWTAYGDAQLNQVVQAALAGNPSLATAQARLQQAQAWVDATDAARQPQANFALDMSDQRFTQNGLFPPPLGGGIFWNNSAQIGVGYQLDLFGRQRAALEASVGRLRATQAEAQAAQLVLASAVVSAYLNVARWVEVRELAEHMQTLRHQLQELIAQRQQAGLDSSVELRQAQSALAQTRIDTSNVDEALARARHALAELSAQAPQALDGLSPRLSHWPSASVPAVLSADLVGRRADIVAQRWRVQASAREVDVAQAEFYPNVNLQAFVGLSSLSLSSFIKPGSEMYGVGPAVSLPLFDGGRLRANLSAKRADLDMAIDGYNASLLRALREVADELGSLRALAQQQQAQEQASAAAAASQALAQQRFQAGLGNQLSVLNAQFAVLGQQRAAIELKARQLLSQVALQRALGGGFQAEPGQPPAVTSTSAL